MKVWQGIKNLFKKGGYALTGEALKTLNDHPKVNIDPSELARIEKSFEEYSGNYPPVEYLNSAGDLMKRDYMHLNMMKLSAELLSGLVFNEQCEISIADDSTEINSFADTDTFIRHVFEHNDFKKNLMRYLDPMFATGGLTVRPYINQENGEIEFSWALANAFYPLRSNSNGISEGVMIFVTPKVHKGETTYYTLMEFHEWKHQQYVITNELYKSDKKQEIGKRVPLYELDVYEDLEEQVFFTGLSRPIFNYLKPAGFNNISPHSPLGLGITDNCKPTLKQINDNFDQFNWEVLMGQRTVFVSDALLQTLPSEDGLPPKQIFDPRTNVFKSLKMGSDQDVIEDVTSDIRTEQYIAAINQSLKTLEMQLQLSVGTFSFDGRSVKTATEIISENSLTYRTRNNQVNEVEKFIKGIIVSCLELAKAYTLKNGKRLFNGEIPSFDHIGVDFDDGIFVDKASQLRFYGQVKTFGLMPNVEIIQRLFKVPKETAEEWIKEIQQEQYSMDPIAIDREASKRLFGDEE